jgi:hypothetical protein
VAGGGADCCGACPFTLTATIIVTPTTLAAINPVLTLMRARLLLLAT